MPISVLRGTGNNCICQEIRQISAFLSVCNQYAYDSSIIQQNKHVVGVERLFRSNNEVMESFNDSFGGFVAVFERDDGTLQDFLHSEEFRCRKGDV